MRVRLQAEPFDPGAETNGFLSRSKGAGASVSFTGLVRSTPDDPIETLKLEHYPELAQRQLETLATEAITRFGLLDAEIIHRFGTLYPNEPIVQVMALALHRQAAFDGANFIMDTLKTEAPFWKKETRGGQAYWVDAKTSDDEAAARWK